MRLAWLKGFQPGEIVGGRYELGEPIGRGGFGVVIHARDLHLGRDVAFKALPPDGLRAGGRLPEADVAARFQHENLVRLYDTGTCASGAYLVFELLDGETVATRLRRGRIPLDEAIRIARDVTRALVHAHSLGVLHRDLKPANVFLPRGGGTKVLDFGLAYLLGARPVRGGTPGYMAPEQRRGDPEDPRTDVYAVGVLLGEMLSGRPPAGVDATEARDRASPPLPRKVAALLHRATSPDPSGRPESAASLASELDGLLREVGEPRDRWVRIGILVSMACAGALGGALVAQVLEAWRSHPTVAVADLENATGDAEFQGLGGLLATSLEQWPRLSVLPRQRLLSLAGEPPELPCDRARKAASRAGARAVLCGRMTRTESGFAVELDTFDPTDGSRLAPTVRETMASLDEAPAIVDAVAGHVRRSLLSAVPWPWTAPVSSVTTSSPDALRAYFRGVDCADRPAHGQDCATAFREALAIDPGFGLAAYRLATWLHWFGGSRAEQRDLVDRALRPDAALPDKERALLHAWRLRLERRDEAAIDLLVRASRIWPADPEPSYQIADLLRHADRLAEAVPWFERAIAQQPDHAWALGGLVQCLGPLRREADLRAWASRWEAEPGPATLHALTLARGWLRDLRGAEDAARTALLLGAGPPAQEDLLAARVFAGDLSGAEGDIRRVVSAGGRIRKMGRYGLAAIASYRGRPRAAVAELDALEREEPEVTRDAVYHAVRADLLLGQGDAAAVWREVEAARRIDPHVAAEHALSLAWMGDLDHARILARELPPEGVLTRTIAAVVRFRQGDRSGALDELHSISDGTPVLAWRVAPLFLYGALLAEDGQDAAAIASLEEAQALYLPLAMWRSWAYPTGLLLVARSSERLGRIDQARRSIDRLLAEWGDAEPDAPGVAEGLAIRSRLGSVVAGETAR